MSSLDLQAGEDTSPTGELHEALTLDRVVHEPARLAILAVLSSAEEVDFAFLLMATGLSKGNLSKQSSKLEEAGYITIRKYFKGKIPATGYRITDKGRAAFTAYWEHITALGQSVQRLDHSERTSND
ncbi:MAG TPA: transcriptional regulator [Chloroflexota bacterium]|nr:transcriptional regulator [Chloroflexota bacterium]